MDAFIVKIVVNRNIMETVTLPCRPMAGDTVMGARGDYKIESVTIKSRESTESPGSDCSIAVLATTLFDWTK